MFSGWCWQLAGARAVTELHFSTKLAQVYSYDRLRISQEERISPNVQTVFEPPFVSCLLTSIGQNRSCGQAQSKCGRGLSKIMDTCSIIATISFLW